MPGCMDCGRIFSHDMTVDHVISEAINEMIQEEVKAIKQEVKEKMDKAIPEIYGPEIAKDWLAAGGWIV